MATKEDQIYVLAIDSISFQESEVCIAYLGLFGVEAIEERTEGLNVYSESLEELNELAYKLRQNLGFLSEKKTSIQQIPSRNWNQEWEKSFSPIIVDDFCTVYAGFHHIQINTPYSILINPEMAFGTGHHETTYLMMQKMRSIAFENCEVLDFGTGTGILAILAEKLGASGVLAIDNDQNAIDCAKKCMVLNDSKSIKCVVSDISIVKNRSNYNIILANINRNVLLNDASTLYQVNTKGGHLLLSGIMLKDFNKIDEAYQNCGYQFVESVQKGEWLCLHYSK